MGNNSYAYLWVEEGRRGANNTKDVSKKPLGNILFYKII